MTRTLATGTSTASKRRSVGTSIELFTGGGGMALAMHAAGLRHLLAVEIAPRACATLMANGAMTFNAGTRPSRWLTNSWPLIEGDIREVAFTPWEGLVDVVAGGVPCQPWSLGGVHKGYEDRRNLWPELFRCVRETRPKVVFAENVRGLLRPTFKPYYDYIMSELALPFEQRIEGEDWRDHAKRLQKALTRPSQDPTERYDVQYWLVNAADYGVPQIRWRVFVVAIRSDVDRGGWDFPAPTHSEAALQYEQGAGDYWERHRIPARPELLSDVFSLPDDRLPWATLRDAISDLPNPIDGAEHPDWLHHVGWPGAREYPGHIPNDLDRPSKTVKAGVHGVPGGESVVRLDDQSIRYLTVREVARVMTFPDHWRLAGPRSEQMRQLGNAVPVDLARAIADSLVGALWPLTSNSLH